MNAGMNPVLRRAVRSALLGGTTVVGPLTHISLAQAQVAPAPAGEAVPTVQEVVVTGSRITSPNLEAISPVTAVTAQEIKDTGVTRVEDLLNSLPQVVADQNSGLSMGSTGIATVNLRGLGASRTLVLINGRRLMGGDPTGGGANIVALQEASTGDINQIPVALIERVDVLTGGASSTYGADAVAGVVNFIMNDHFEGVRIDANLGIYNHDNHQGWIDPLLKDRHFPTVTGSNWDGANKDLTLVLGSSFADGKGHMEGYLGYRRASPITADHRDHAACVLSNTYSGSHGYICGGSSNSAPSVIYQTGPTGTGASDQICDPAQGCTTGATGDLVKKYARFNYAASHYIQRIDERYTAGFFGNLKVNDHAEVYSEFMMMDDETRGNYAPAGLFLGSGFAITPPGNPGAGLRNGNWIINCGVGGFGNPGMNPYLTLNEFTNLCAPAASNAYAAFIAPNGDAQFLMARRNIEGGPREDQYTHTTFRGVFGVRGEVIPDWTYDVSGTYGVVRVTDYHNNDTSSALMQDAMLAVRNAAGQIVCRSGNSGCIPWNIFNPAGPSAALALPYFSVPGEVQATGQEDIVTAFVDGDLTHAGVKLPTADDGLKVVLGTEYRREVVQFHPDAELLRADLAGLGSPTIGYDATFHVWEGFTEARLPLVRHVPGFEVLDLEAGYRYSNYTSGFKTDTYKVGLTWAPVKDFRLRGSFNQAVRAPNAAELGKPVYVGLDAGSDVCAAPTAYTPAQCAYTNGANGRSPAPFPAVPSPAGQYNGQIGGNANLKPETGKTTSVGIVFTPTFLPAFSLSVDYSDIKITGLISSYGPNFIQTECITTHSPFWCETVAPSIGFPGVHRDPAGTLWASPQGYTIDPLVNTGGERSKTIDVGLSYRQTLGNLGQLRARLDGSYLEHLFFTPGGPNPLTFDCAGRFGPSCQPATPSWRHRFGVDWDTPFTGLGFGVTWRYIGSVTNTLLDPKTPDYNAAIAAVGPADPRLGSVSYLDLRASYTFGKATIRLGCNNVTDKDPPLFDTVNTGANSTAAESNTNPGVYDISGRYLYANVTIDF
jgi:iron complex outermembrane recepter protein